MAKGLNYTVSPRLNPQEKDAPARFYANAVSNGVMTMDEWAEQIAARCTIKEADVVGIMKAFAEAFSEALLDGYIVDLDQIGKFRLTCTSKGTDTYDDFNSYKIQGINVRYTPAKKLKEALNAISFNKLGGTIAKEDHEDEEFYYVRLYANPTDGGTVKGGDGEYYTGDDVTIEAVANDGYHFVKWSDGNTNAKRTIQIDGSDVSYTATFEKDEEEEVEQIFIGTATNDNSMGSVTGMGTYAKGTAVTIEATANTGYHFVQWTDEVTDNPRTVTADVNGTIYTAVFEAD